MGRRYPDRPVLSVAGVVLAGDRVLLVKRGRPPAQGIWSVPGGAVEAGESLSQALQREIMEETGVAVQVGPLVEVVERMLADSEGRLEYHYVILDYLCRASLVEPQAGSDAAAARWVAFEELAQAGLTPDTEAVVRRAWEMNPGH
ncbi:NUDIX hydrolase [Desulfocarbo indianensis]|nr:NUDIX hydrolase [Desulfocarbo indianensis]